GAQRVVDHIAFDVGAGEVVGLLGPNGAGKTTTLRMLAGLLTPTAGSAKVCGFDASSQPIDARLKQRVDEVISELGLSDFIDDRCGSLSSGQKQRVSIGRAVLHDPEVYV